MTRIPVSLSCIDDFGKAKLLPGVALGPLALKMPVIDVTSACGIIPMKIYLFTCRTT